MRIFRKIAWVKWLWLIIIIIGFAGWVRPVWAQTAVPEKPVYIYLFWGDGCPHCAKAKPYFESLESKYPGVVVKSFEVYYDQENQQLFINMASVYGLEQLGVPTTFIGSNYLQGYSEEFNDEIESVVVQCLQNGCIDPAEKLAIALTSVAPTASASPQPTIVPTSSPVAVTPGSEEPAIFPTEQPALIDQQHILDVPIIGSVDLGMQSSALSTVLIALVDGFNPCSLWVLSMLLALTLHTGSRQKVFLIGLIFLTITAAIYALFIAGLFSVLKIASYMVWIQVLAALVALFFAVVNIKDYFWYKKGISFTIADEKKPGIFKRIRAVMDASQSFWGLAGATAALAVGVSVVEFSCTAGFPVVWTNLLNTQGISGVAFVFLLLLYMLIYQLDEMAIFSSAVISLKSSRLEEKHGRALKLIGGILMLTLSIVMLINPTLMNKLSSSLIIFGIAFLATLLILLIHRVILPKFGVRIGTDIDDQSKARI